MFTPSELREKAFKSGLGYDKKDVEQFLNELSSDYELLLQENNDLKKQTKDLNESISYYKSIEKTLQKALVLAEKTAQDTIATAIRESEAIEHEAKVKAKAIQADSKKQLELLEHKTLNLIQQYDLFKIHFENLLNAQLELINSNSFSINTVDFQYKEELIDKVDRQEEEERLSAPKMEDTTQIKFEFLKETSEQSYQTEDGFEFISLGDE